MPLGHTVNAQVGGEAEVSDCTYGKRGAKLAGGRQVQLISKVKAELSLFCYKLFSSFTHSANTEHLLRTRLPSKGWRCGREPRRQKSSPFWSFPPRQGRQQRHVESLGGPPPAPTRQGALLPLTPAPPIASGGSIFSPFTCRATLHFPGGSGEVASSWKPSWRPSFSGFPLGLPLLSSCSSGKSVHTTSAHSPGGPQARPVGLTLVCAVCLLPGTAW